MSCDPERVTGFVDGELDAATAVAVAAHLESCPSCRAQAEAERELRVRLRSLPTPELPAGVEARVRQASRVRPSAVPVAARWALPLAAVLLLGVWLRGYAPFVAWELARDHDHCFSRQPLPAQVRSDDPGVVAAWFEEHGTRLPQLPERVGELALAGARLCPMPDASAAAHVYYASATSQVSVFLVRHGVRLEGRLARQTHGRSVRLLRVGGEVLGVVGPNEAEAQAFEVALQPKLLASTRR